ncbi:MAG: DUF559 domain-containing protein [Brevundimonas sp.]|uniref:DUF559 domain-containing protein n=1 Tax=Brevundimonas sp. TaxID=1871086 RepID=UPI0025BADD63|nr:DUF559 domain-containing protein [Brevundimonas sp.]MBX3476584.1 DUF559 domain-containing protein [Brevundimonas sp.]
MDDWLQSRAKEMRRQPALYERRLWRLLRDRRLEDLKFRRQVVIGCYIADFVCLRHRLIVEADGPSHEDRALHDAERDAWFAAENFIVLRFPNSQIENRPWGVIDAITAASKRKLVKD